MEVIYVIRSDGRRLAVRAVDQAAMLTTIPGTESAATSARQDEELRWLVVVSAYLDEEISMARAASLLDLHPLELRERFMEKGIPLRLGPTDKTDAQAEVDALRVWKRKRER